MKFTRRILYLAAAVVVIAVAAGPRGGVTRPYLRCEVPDRDYQYRDYSQPASSVSAVGILVRDPLPTPGMTESQRETLRLTGNAVALRAIKAYQFVERPRLQVDHCSISRITVNLCETGEWTLSLRADQNPTEQEQPAAERRVTTSEEITKFTDHLKRNLFKVELRCYARTGSSIADSAVGKPVVIPLPVEPFWVQRQQPRWYVDSGNEPWIRRHFDSIDRVEIEFTYGNRAPVGAKERTQWYQK